MKANINADQEQKNSINLLLYAVSGDIQATTGTRIKGSRPK